MSTSVEFPTYLLNERGAINQLRDSDIYRWLANRRIVLISGKGETRTISERLFIEMKWRPSIVKALYCTDNTIDTIEELGHQAEKVFAEVVIGVGGGKVLDVSKVVGTRINAPVMLVPTAISSDAICSPIAVIRKTKTRNVSIMVDMPRAVVIDLDIVSLSPPRLITAGIGDLLSNKTALFDWKLAQQANQENINTLASIIANNAVEAFLNTVQSQHNRSPYTLLKTTAESLILSGISMAISGNSRPCSGSEHLISHALDYYCGSKALHGEQVAVALLISEYLQGQHKTDSNLRQHFTRLGLPTHYMEIGYTKEEMRLAIRMAPTIRNRYTILNEWELSDKQIEYILDEVFPG